MHILFVALQDDGILDEVRKYRNQNEIEQILIILDSLHKNNKIKIKLVCFADSILYKKACSLGISTLPIKNKNPNGLLTRFFLWNWQRKCKKIIIQTFGEESVQLGHQIYKMRNDGSVVLSHAFFFAPPSQEICLSKEMISAKYIIYGSRYIRKRILSIWRDHNAKVMLPTERELLIHITPSINLSQYTNIKYNRFDSVERYIFCMGGSLLPKSGARMMLRAMSAMWQRQDLPHWEVRMLGGGPRFEEILLEAKNLGVESRLSILGDQEFNNILSNCHVWVAPGSSAEECPDTLWAGFAANIPVICSDSPLHLERLGCSDYEENISSKINMAILVSENSPQDLAKAMMHIMQYPELCKKLCIKANERNIYVKSGDMANSVNILYETWLRNLGS